MKAEKHVRPSHAVPPLDDMELVRRVLVRDGDAFRLDHPEVQPAALSHGPGHPEETMTRRKTPFMRPIPGLYQSCELSRRLKPRDLALPHRDQRSLGRLRTGGATWTSPQSRGGADARGDHSISISCTKVDDPERTMAQRQLLQLVEQATEIFLMSTGWFHCARHRRDERRGHRRDPRPADPRP